MKEMLPDKQRAEAVARIAAQQRGYFNARAEVFDVPQPAEVMERLRQIVAEAGLQPGAAVLDVGTGVGVLIPLIQFYRPSMVAACDLSEAMLSRFRANHPGVPAFQCDVVRPAFRAAAFDALFMNAMFGNLADKPAVCRHAADALKRGGRLIVSHPEGRAFVERLRAAGDLFIEPFPGRAEFAALLAPAGLELVSYRDEPKLFVMVARKR